MNENVVKLQELLKKLRIKELLITPNDPLLFWINAPSDDSFVIISSEGLPIIISSPLSDFSSSATSFSSWVFFKSSNPLFALKKLLFFKKVAVNDPFLSTADYKFLLSINKNPVNINKHLSTIMRIKNNDEVSLLKNVASLTADLFKAIVNNFSSFKYENDIVLFIKKFALDNACGLSFNPIVASADNTAIPHYEPEKNNSLINNGFLIIDAGLRLNGYCSDMTRTFFVGNPSVNDRRIYNKVLSLHKSVLKKAVPGARVSNLDLMVRDVFGGHFIHSLGHGVGVQVHEAPRINFKSKEILNNNEVVAIEPAYYDSDNGFGVRIEDMVLVGDKPLVLTRFPTNLVVLER